jgi:RNA polymerase sigma factor (sigma-70 family)
MERWGCGGAVSWSVFEDIDGDLLKQTQMYLISRFLRQSVARELQRAWDEFYRRCDPQIRRFAVACRTPAASLEDCVQQVWTELIKQLRNFHYDPGRGRFASWVYTLVHSRAIELIRRGSRHPAKPLRSETAAELCGQDEDPAAACERQCQQAAVRRGLDELQHRVSELSFQVLRLRWLEGRTVQETATCLGLTPAKVWAREHRMKRKLRALLRSWDHSNRHQEAG